MIHIAKYKGKVVGILVRDNGCSVLFVPGERDGVATIGTFHAKVKDANIQKNWYYELWSWNTKLATLERLNKVWRYPKPKRTILSPVSFPALTLLKVHPDWQLNAVYYLSPQTCKSYGGARNFVSLVRLEPDYSTAVVNIAPPYVAYENAIRMYKNVEISEVKSGKKKSK